MSSLAGPAHAGGRATAPTLNLSSASLSKPLEISVATFTPLSAGATLPGEGSAFRIVRGWDADPSSLKTFARCAFLVPPRGLSPGAHLTAALHAADTDHPLSGPPCIGEGPALAIAAQLAMGPEISVLRLRRVALARTWVKELAHDQGRLAAASDPALRHFAVKPTLVLQRILTIIDSPARHFLANLHEGLPDVGKAAVSGIFPRIPQADPLLSVDDLLRGAPDRNKELVERVRRNHFYAKEFWAQGVAAEQSGAVGPPLPLETWLPRADVVFCRKFPVVQSKPVGDELLEPVRMQFEVRSCIDASSSPAGSGHNLCWAPAERIVCSDAEVIAAQMLASQLAFGSPPVGGKEDLKKAYHQVGRSRGTVRLVQLFWDPAEKAVVGREQWAQDFWG